MKIVVKSRQKLHILISVNSGVSGPNVARIVHNVEKYILFHLLKSELRYCNPFPNGSAAKKTGPGKTRRYSNLLNGDF